jgi:hypothetical protein
MLSYKKALSVARLSEAKSVAYLSAQKYLLFIKEPNQTQNLTFCHFSSLIEPLVTS